MNNVYDFHTLGIFSILPSFELHLDYYLLNYWPVSVQIFLQWKDHKKVFLPGYQKRYMSYAAEK